MNTKVKRLTWIKQDDGSLFGNDCVIIRKVPNGRRIKDGYRYLIETIDGVVVDSCSTLNDAKANAAIYVSLNQ